MSAQIFRNVNQLWAVWHASIELLSCSNLECRSITYLSDIPRDSVATVWNYTVIIVPRTG